MNRQIFIASRERPHANRLADGIGEFDRVPKRATETVEPNRHHVAVNELHLV